MENAGGCDGGGAVCVRDAWSGAVQLYQEVLMARERFRRCKIWRPSACVRARPISAFTPTVVVLCAMACDDPSITVIEWWNDLCHVDVNVRSTQLSTHGGSRPPARPPPFFCSYSRRVRQGTFFFFLILQDAACCIAQYRRHCTVVTSAQEEEKRKKIRLLFFGQASKKVSGQETYDGDTLPILLL